MPSILPHQLSDRAIEQLQRMAVDESIGFSMARSNGRAVRKNDEALNALGPTESSLKEKQEREAPYSEQRADRIAVELQKVRSEIHSRRQRASQLNKEHDALQSWHWPLATLAARIAAEFERQRVSDLLPFFEDPAGDEGAAFEAGLNHGASPYPIGTSSARVAAAYSGRGAK